MSAFELPDPIHAHALIEAAQRGDRAAFCDLARPHLAALRARARRAASGSTCDPEDIVQETLLRAFDTLENFDPQYTFAQFLFGIARYAELTAARTRQREVAVAWTESTTAGGDGMRLPAPGEIPEGFHALAGAARFPTPDETTKARHRYLALLSALLSDGGYPHQQIAFGYGVMLWGKPKRRQRNAEGLRQRPDKVEITGDPGRVVSELGARRLRDTGREFRVELEIGERLDSETLDDIFAPFDYRLSLEVEALFKNDASSRALFAALFGTKTGETELERYFGRKPERSVTEWCRAVKERVRRSLTGSGAPRARTRTRFPMPPGHEAPHNSSSSSESQCQ